MSISYWLDESKNNSFEFDFTVVGAGIAGISTAYWLEKNYPSAKIALIDKGNQANGASGRNAGFVTCGSTEHFNKLKTQFGLEKAVEIWKFSEVNRQLLKEHIIQSDESEIDFYQTGACTVASTIEDWTRYQSNYSTMKSVGLDVDLVDSDYLEKFYGVRNALGGIQYNKDGIVHPVKLQKKIKSLLKNTSFFFNEEVFNIENEKGKVKLRSERSTLFSEKTFLCLNVYLPLLFPEFKKHITPQRSQVLVTERLPPFVKGPCYLTKHLCYFRQLHTGELLVGGFRNVDLDAENTIIDEPTPLVQKALNDFTKTFFTTTQNVKIEHRWSGIMGFTADGQMLIGAHPNQQNIHIMAGCSGHGMGLSFNAAKTLVESVSGQRVPKHLDISRIRL